MWSVKRGRISDFTSEITTKINGKNNSLLKHCTFKKVV